MRQEPCLFPVFLAIATAVRQDCRIYAGRVWASPAHGGTPLLVPPRLGMPQREAQLWGPGPGIFDPHLVTVMAEPMPASCVRGRDVLPGWVAGSSTLTSSPPLSLPQRRRGQRGGKLLLLGYPLKPCL